MSAVRLFYHVKNLWERDIFVLAIHILYSTTLVLYFYLVSEKLKKTYYKPILAPRNQKLINLSLTRRRISTNQRDTAVIMEGPEILIIQE